MKIEIVKPVIPQFIADWIEQEKKCTTFHKSFSRAINLVKHDEGWREWEYKVGNRWSKILATAWIHGYEVEQPPLYYAKIKGWELTEGESVFWKSCIITENPMLPRLYTGNKEEDGFVRTKMTIQYWNEVGINNTNADFEKVEQQKGV